MGISLAPDVTFRFNLITIELISTPTLIYKISVSCLSKKQESFIKIVISIFSFLVNCPRELTSMSGIKYTILRDSFWLSELANITLPSSCEAISASDYVEFSNFMARDRKYSRHCGQLKEFDVRSDRKFFRVTFRSNDRLDGTGFNATYGFTDEVESVTGRPDSTLGATTHLG